MMHRRSGRTQNNKGGGGDDDTTSIDTLLSVPLGGGGSGSNDDPKTSNRTTKKQRRQKRLRRKRTATTTKKDSICDYLILGLLFTLFTIFIFGIAFFLIFIISSLTDPHSEVFKRGYGLILRGFGGGGGGGVDFRYSHPDVVKYTPLYESVYNVSYEHNHHHDDYYSANNHLSKEEMEEQLIAKVMEIEEQLITTSYRKPKYDVTFAYGDDVMEEGCDLTIMVMDPRIPIAEKGDPIWYSLESAAAFVPNACVVLMTSKCKVEETYEVEEDEVNEIDLFIHAEIYKKSFPLFRELMNRGQLRITFINHGKYKLKACDDFMNPSSAFMNVNFWREEFVEDVDSDTILTLQADSVLCHSFNVEKWRKYAFVGAVWPREPTELNPEPREGMCVGMPIRWKTWTFPQQLWMRQEEKNRQDGNNGEDGQHHHRSNKVPKPDNLLNLDFPEICSGTDGEAPIGNGGFSLRNRNWMIRAIETCPHTQWAGFNTDYNGNFACKLFDGINEDFYFGTVLRGIRAPMPSAFEASLFSLEMKWPEEVVDLYGGPTRGSDRRKIARDLWGLEKDSYAMSEGVHSEVGDAGAYFSVPVGMHKPWYYQPNALLLDEDVEGQCPFLRYIYDPEDSKWEDISKKKKKIWAGIGT